MPSIKLGSKWKIKSPAGPSVNPDFAGVVMTVRECHGTHFVLSYKAFGKYVASTSWWSDLGILRDMEPVDIIKTAKDLEALYA